MFARKSKDKDQDFRHNVLQTESFGLQKRKTVWHKANAAFQEKNLILTVKQEWTIVSVMLAENRTEPSNASSATELRNIYFH